MRHSALLTLVVATGAAVTLIGGPATLDLLSPHALAQGVVWLIRQHRIDSDRHIGNTATKQPLANPSAAQDGVIVHGIGM